MSVDIPWSDKSLKYDFTSDPIQDFVKCIKKPIIVHAKQMQEDFQVDSLEGIVKGKQGDYLMIGVKGEKYIIRKDIFYETYSVI